MDQLFQENLARDDDQQQWSEHETTDKRCQGPPAHYWSHGDQHINHHLEDGSTVMFV